MKTLRKLSFRGKKVWGFVNWIRAGAHICDHLLTLPEAHAWSVIHPWLKPIVESRSGFETAKRMWSEQGDADFQRLYDAYMSAVQFALASSEGEGWHGEEKDGSGERALGINGVLTVLGGDRVLTAYIPGVGDRTTVQPMEDLEPEEEEALRERDPLPRARRPEKPDADKFAKIGERERLAKIFKKAAKSVRWRDVNWYSRDMHSLKRMTLEQWEAVFGKYASTAAEEQDE
ncbi:MAG: hypothetical protein LBT97_14010 [Planctomycetota bacterium]|jgi:hypothetical protein|nr:hypothetical protein [Planctomycetota bacterium]